MDLRSISESFFEKYSNQNEADYILLGVPLDLTASYRSGCRLAPMAIRNESKFMESYSVRTGLDLGDLNLFDAGDLKDLDKMDEALEIIRKTVIEIMQIGKVPVILGGEHTATLGALRAIRPDLVVVFDAHLDLRYMLYDEKLCHATYLRRGCEEIGFKVIIIGARALSIEEVKFAKEAEITVVTALDIKRFGVDSALSLVKDAIEGGSSIYISIDMDVIDPSEAPAVGNPSPEGISVTELLDITSGIIDDRVKGFDVTEVSPSYDSGLTAIQAAYIIIEMLYAHAKTKRGFA